MTQQGQVFELKRRDSNGAPLWAFRYRLAGRDSRRVQRGGVKTPPGASGSSTTSANDRVPSGIFVQ